MGLEGGEEETEGTPAPSFLWKQLLRPHSRALWSVPFTRGSLCVSGLSCPPSTVRGRIRKKDAKEEAGGRGGKAQGTYKHLSCREKHSSSHEGNEMRGNCETQRFDKDLGKLSGEEGQARRWR